MSFIYMPIKNRETNSFAHSLALKQRLRTTRKWSVSFRGDCSYNSVTLAHQLSFAKGPLMQVNRPLFFSLCANQIAGTFPTKCYRVQSLWALSLGGVFVIATCPTNTCPGTWGITYDHKGRIIGNIARTCFSPAFEHKGILFVVFTWPRICFHRINLFYYINTNEIPGKLTRENLISSHVKMTCYLHVWKYHRCYGYIINSAFHTKNY